MSGIGIELKRRDYEREGQRNPDSLGVNALPTFGLSPPDASGSSASLLGLSPGATSDLSNEAAQGHSVSLRSAMAAPSNSANPLYASMQAAGVGQSANLSPQARSAADTYGAIHEDAGSPSLSFSQSTPRIIGGFEAAGHDDAANDAGPSMDGYSGGSAIGNVSDIGSMNATSMQTSPSLRTTDNAPAAANGHTLYAGTGAEQASSLGNPGNAASSSFANAATDELIPTTFDESTLRALCDMDCGMPLLYDRIKQSMLSTTHASAFFKKRAAIEEEYGRSMLKLAKSTAEAYGTTDAKAGSYVSAWQSMLKTHEVLGDSRIRFSHKLSEISEELANLAKEVDKNRKYARDTGNRLERNLLDAETSVEKSRGRFDAAAEDLERLLLLKSGESTKGGELQGLTTSGPPGKRTLGKAIGKGGLLFKNKNPQQILRQEEDIRTRTSNASDAFRKEVLATQGIRQEYFNLQLPRILRSLKESSEEIDNGLQYHLSRYAFLFESTVLSDGMSITPIATVDGATGLKSAVETIDNRTDFKQYMQNYSVLHAREYKGPRREGPYEEGFVASGSMSGSSMSGAGAFVGGRGGPGHTASGSISTVSTRPIFGVGLADQMIRDNVDVPPILEKCAEAIEEIGLENKGIYRLSGTTSKVQKLKAKFDTDWSSVDLTEDEAINDINIVAGCLKLWFRELPEPLMTWELYGGFIEAAKIENDRLRHIRMHERVNDLPDANYATLKYLMGHLDKIRSRESINQMSASNLAIVFGPTLLRAPPADGSDADPSNVSGANLQDMSFQCKAIETILERYEAIFVDEEE